MSKKTFQKISAKKIYIIFPFLSLFLPSAYKGYKTLQLFSWICSVYWFSLIKQVKIFFYRNNWWFFIKTLFWSNFILTWQVSFIESPKSMLFYCVWEKENILTQVKTQIIRSQLLEIKWGNYLVCILKFWSNGDIFKLIWLFIMKLWQVLWTLNQKLYFNTEHSFVTLILHSKHVRYVLLNNLILIECPQNSNNQDQDRWIFFVAFKVIVIKPIITLQ